MRAVNVVPLTNPDGVVIAWQCGVCLHVPTMGRMFGGLARVGEFADRAKREAWECCRCSRCGQQIGPEFHHGACDACQLIEDVEQAARVATWAEESGKRDALAQAALALSRDRSAACVLVADMRDISESHYAAGWMGGLEFDLWAMVCGGPRDYGMGEVSEAQVASLRDLSERAGGWWRWQDGVCEVFVTADEWAKMYAERSKAAKGETE